MTTTYEKHGTGDPNAPGEIVDAGADWLTCTGLHGVHQPAMKALANRIYEEALDGGTEPSTASVPRYRGFAVDGMFYGEREEDCLLRLSGATAKAHLEEAVAICRNVSRFDAQVTVQLPSADIGVARRQYGASQSGTGRKGRPPKSQLILNSTGGATAYLGSRQSARYVRVYDKGAESGDAAAGMLWRVEVELKEDAGLRAAAWAAAQNSQAEAASRICAVELERKGGVVNWSPSSLHYNSSGPAHTPTLDRKLEWLAAQVRPTVAALREAGRIEDLEAALGITIRRS